MAPFGIKCENKIKNEVEVYWISPRLMLEVFGGGFDLGDQGWGWSWWRGMEWQNGTGGGMSECFWNME
jgi:hypothetical protein